MVNFPDCVDHGSLLTHPRGMAKIMTCARGIAKLLRGGAWEDTGLPECFQPTSERLIGNGSKVRENWTGCSSAT